MEMCRRRRPRRLTAELRIMHVEWVSLPSKCQQCIISIQEARQHSDGLIFRTRPTRGISHWNVFSWSRRHRSNCMPSSMSHRLIFAHFFPHPAVTNYTLLPIISIVLFLACTLVHCTEAFVCVGEMKILANRIIDFIAVYLQFPVKNRPAPARTYLHQQTDRRQLKWNKKPLKMWFGEWPSTKHTLSIFSSHFSLFCNLHAKIMRAVCFVRACAAWKNNKILIKSFSVLSALFLLPFIFQFSSFRFFFR